MDLPAFLAARIAEDEETAQAAAPSPWGYSDIESVAGGTLYDATVAIADIAYDVDVVDPRIRRFRSEEEADATGRHIARHDPARVLAECATKRAIIEDCVAALVKFDRSGAWGDWPDITSKQYAERTLELLAQPFADHPDFDPAWHVDEPARSS